MALVGLSMTKHCWNMLQDQLARSVAEGRCSGTTHSRCWSVLTSVQLLSVNKPTLPPRAGCPVWKSRTRTVIAGKVCEKQQFQLVTAIRMPAHTRNMHEIRNELVDGQNRTAI